MTPRLPGLLGVFLGVFLVFDLASLTGCHDGIVVVVTVAKIPDSAAALEVLATLQNGAPGSPLSGGDFLVPEGAAGPMGSTGATGGVVPTLPLAGVSDDTRKSYSFGLRLPVGNAGKRIVIGVAARDPKGCLLLTGTGEVTLPQSGDNPSLTVSLDAVDPTKPTTDCFPTLPAVSSVSVVPVIGGKNRLHVTGWGFSPGAAVSLLDSAAPAGQPLPIGNLSVSIAQLEFDQPSVKSDTGHLSGAQLTVKNPAGNAATAPVDLYRVVFASRDHPLSLDLSPCTPNATGAAPFAFHPDALTLADLDGDGALDIALSGNKQERGVVAVFLNKDKKGSFTAPPLVFCLGTAAAPANAQQIVAADLDGDGKIDLAVTNFGQSTVSILYNQGVDKGLFLRQGVSAWPAGGSPDSLTVGDVNGDGRPDLVVGDYNLDPQNMGEVYALLNQKSNPPTFQFAQMPMHTMTPTFGVAFGMGFLSVQDLDGDGKPDLAANGLRLIQSQGAILPVTGGLFVVLNSKASPYLPLPPVADVLNGVNSYATAGRLGHLLIRDLDGDGFPDALVSGVSRGGTAQGGFVNGEISVLFNNTHGAFGPAYLQADPITYPAGDSPYFMGLADIDGDKVADLLVANSPEMGAGTVTIVLGKSGTTPMKRDDVFVRGLLPSFPIDFGSPSLAVGDLNGDGKPDVAVATLKQYGDPLPGHLTVLLNNSSPNP